MKILKCNKSFFAIIVIGLGLLLSAPMVSCSGKGDKSATDSIEENVETYEVYFDTVVFEKKTKVAIRNNTEVNICILYAVGGHATLCDSINAWVKQILTDGMKNVDGDDIPTLVEKKGAAMQKELAKDITDQLQGQEYDYEYDEYGYDDDHFGSEDLYVPDTNGEIEILKIYEDDEYITLKLKREEFHGGAHGSAFAEGCTFRKIDGHIMGWDLLDFMTISQIQEEIKRGLKEYFEVNTDKELFEQLDVHKITLPETAPYLTKLGINLQYQQYEIACYAAGMPWVIIER